MISWNIATKNIPYDIGLQNRIRPVIGKLERHLKSFPPNVVHLQIVIEKQKREGLFTTALTLDLPSGILRTEKAGKDALESIGAAVPALLGELEEVKSKLRREPLWKRVARQAELHDKKAKFASAPSVKPIRDEAESIRLLLERFYPRLLAYIRRRIRRAELEGEAPSGRLEAEAILNSGAEKALSLTLKEAHSSGGIQDCLLLLYTLTAQELRKRIAAIHREQGTHPPNTGPRDLADPRSGPPDELTARKELLETLQTVIRQWPKDEHELFDLYFIEGFEPHEIAVIMSRPVSKVELGLQEMQARFRCVLTEENWGATAR